MNLKERESWGSSFQAISQVLSTPWKTQDSLSTPQDFSLVSVPWPQTLPRWNDTKCKETYSHNSSIKAICWFEMQVSKLSLFAQQWHSNFIRSNLSFIFTWTPKFLGDSNLKNIWEKNGGSKILRQFTWQKSQSSSLRFLKIKISQELSPPCGRDYCEQLILHNKWVEVIFLSRHKQNNKIWQTEVNVVNKSCISSYSLKVDTWFIS